MSPSPAPTRPGTTFTVDDLTTGLRVISGAGNDTLVLEGLSFSEAQRSSIFALGSVETITDLSGSYTAPTVALTLTTGTDTFAGTGADEEVTGTAATLNPTDSLDGGGGTDMLSLFGAGTFNLSTLASFTGFEVVNLTSVASAASNLTIGNGVDLTVNVDNTYGGNVTLGDGATTLNLGSSLGYTVNASSGTATVNHSGYHI